MSDVLDRAKQKLDEEKKKIIAKELRIKQLEKKNLLNKWIEIGKLAHKANIHDIETDVLFGAFLEIYDFKKENTNLEKWKNKSKHQEIKLSLEAVQPLTVKFTDSLDKGHNSIMRELNFKWNRFRKEFYGHGNKTEIQSKLKDFDCVIEEIK